MKNKTVSRIMLTLLLTSLLTFGFTIPAKAGRYTYDGPWDTDGWVILESTTLTNDVSFADWGIIIDADNITLDLNGYTVIGPGSGWDVGVRVNGRTGVTVKNGRIEGFRAGIGVYTAWVSGGVYRKSVDVTVEGNIVTDNLGDGIFLNAQDSTVNGNIVTDNGRVGVNISPEAAHNTIKENYISNNGWGINLYGRYPNGWNKFYHNDLINNTCQAKIDYSQGIPIGNSWDNGYPSGGNYWSDYSTKYPDAQELDGSGIWDTPYVIDSNNQDNYPLMEPWTPIEVPPVEDTEAYIKYVNETIQDLTDEVFSKPEEDVPDVKNDFSDLFNDTLENINEGNYDVAIEKLNGIKGEIYEEMVESAEREEIISLIDDLIAYLESLL